MTSLSICLSGSYANCTALQLISCLSGKFTLPLSLSSKSRKLNILSLAAIPFIAIWKNEPSCRIGMKKSADKSIISKQPAISICPLLNCNTDIISPSAAPPYATKSIIVMELSCIVSTFIVIFLNFSDSSFIRLFLYSSD